MGPFRTEQLANGITVEFFDRSNRYFGDYHRVCVEVRLIAAAAGATVKTLERMAVPGAEVAAECARLVDDFWRHAGSYLAHPDYPARLAQSTSSRRPGFRP